MSGGELVVRAWKWRAYPTPEQALVLEGQCHAARGLWNMLHEWYLWGGRGKRPTWKQADEAIRQARKDIDWLSQLPAQAAQQVLKTYIQAWVNYWENGAGRPDFHSVRSTRLAVDVPQARDLNITDTSTKRHPSATVNIPLLGKLTVRTHRQLPDEAKISGARIVQEPDRTWTVVLRVQVPSRPALMGPLPAIGLDRGITKPVAGRDTAGADLDWGHGEWLTPGETARLHRLERQAARRRHARWNRNGGQGKGRIGANERDTYTQISDLRAKAARRRKEWHHQLSHQIATTHSLVGLEQLLITNMTRTAKGTLDQPGSNVSQKTGLNRAILNEGWATLAQYITYKLEERNGTVIPVPAAGTSQTCHACDNRASEQRENQALFRCVNTVCGWTGNADHNAAANILKTALSMGVNMLQPTERGLQPASLTKAGQNPHKGTGRDPEVFGSRKREKRHATTKSKADVAA